MNRPLLITVINGIPYCIDVARDELWQQDGSKNRIPFLVFRQQKGDYVFLYNVKSKTIPKDRGDAMQHYSDLRWVTFLALMELDPEVIALRYDIPLEVLCPD